MGTREPVYPREGCRCLVAQQDFHLFVCGGIVHRYLHQKAVQLGFRQLVGALLFHWVLRRDDGKDIAHRAGRTVDGHLPLLHHLEEGCLGLGGSSVNLVGQHHVGEDRSGVEVEVSGLHVVDRGAQHVARHEVGGKLHAREAGVDELGHDSGQQGLGHAGHALNQHVSAGYHAGQQEVGGLCLAHYDLRNAGSQRLYLGGAGCGDG